MNAVLSTFAVQRARTLVRAAPPREGGLLDPSRTLGRVVEVSEAGAHGALSAVCGLVLQVQQKGEPAAWVEAGPTIFFPPDLAFRGLDLGALTVILAPGTRAALGVADGLLRSGAFGLVVLDGVTGPVDEAWLGRLARLAEDHRTTVLFLTRKTPEEPSLGSLVSLRGAVAPGPGGTTEVRVLKDKCSGPPTRERYSFHGPSGLY
jgi:hypothetical protein